MQVEGVTAMIKKGFSIVEVLVVIGIMGLIMTVGTVGYRDFSRRQAVGIAKRQMVADLREAQSDASSGRKPSACSGSLIGYGFEVTAGNPANYRVFARCETLGVQTDHVVRTATLPSEVTITIPATNPVLFKSLEQGTNLASGTSVTISISASNAANMSTLVISSSGEIK